MLKQWRLEIAVTVIALAVAIPQIYADSQRPKMLDLYRDEPTCEGKQQVNLFHSEKDVR